jgi:hypothetical protein
LNKLEAKPYGSEGGKLFERDGMSSGLNNSPRRDVGGRQRSSGHWDEQWALAEQQAPGLVAGTGLAADARRPSDEQWAPGDRRAPDEQRMPEEHRAPGWPAAGVLRSG